MKLLMYWFDTWLGANLCLYTSWEPKLVLVRIFAWDDNDGIVCHSHKMCVAFLGDSTYKFIWRLAAGDSCITIVSWKISTPYSMICLVCLLNWDRRILDSWCDTWFVFFYVLLLSLVPYHSFWNSMLEIFQKFNMPLTCMFLIF